MKDPKDWHEEDLLNLPPGEHDWIEYKGRRTLDLTADRVDENDVRGNLSKAISAFANSGGGTLVLGINDRTIQVDDGGISQKIKPSGTKEWLEDVIPTLVEPTLIKFNVYPIIRETENSNILLDRAVYVIQIEDSQQAPHQASDNKYYGRVGGKSRPLPHRMVVDIMGRRKHPIIDISCTIIEYGDTYYLSFSAKNIGNVICNYMTCYFSFPEGFLEEDPDKRFEPSYLSSQDGGRVMVVCRRNFIRPMRTKKVKAIISVIEDTDSLPQYDPILPELNISWSFIISYKWGPFLEKYVYWKVYADNAPLITGKKKINDIEVEEVRPNDIDEDYL